MKKLFNLSIIFILSLFLFACSASITIKKNSPTSVNINYDYEDQNIKASDTIRNFDLSFDTKDLQKYVKKIEKLLTKKNKLNALNAAYIDLIDYYDHIIDVYIIINTLHYANGSLEDVTKAYKTIYKYYLSIIYEIARITKKIAESSYRDAFFSGVDKELLDEFINSYIDNTEVIEMMVEKKELEEKFINEKSDDKAKIDILNEFISLNKYIAISQGYEDNQYIEYSDSEVYNRTYTEKDIDTLTNSYKRWLMCKPYNDKMFSFENFNINQETLDELTKLKYGDFFENKDLFDDFIEAMGTTYKQAYEDLFNNGYYLFSKYDDSNGIAFQTNSDDINLLFFGSGSNNLSTFAHEFGHYHAAYIDKTNHSYDFLETQSQASEVLFRLYINENNKNLASMIYEANYVQDLLYAINIGITSRYFEASAYKYESISLDWAFSNTTREFGTYFQNGYYQAAINDNYYISYATGAISSLLIYLYGKEHGFEAARDIYLSFVSYDGEGDFIEALESIGLRDPFAPETAEYIKQSLNNLYNAEWNYPRK